MESRQKQFIQILVENQMSREREIIDSLEKNGNLEKEQLKILLETKNQKAIEYLHERARETAHRIYGNKVYMVL